VGGAGGRLRWRLQDPWGFAIGAGEQPAAAGELEPGLPVCRLNGLHRLDLWLLNDGGAVENWGYAAIEVGGGPELTAEPLFDHASPGDTVRYRVRSPAAGRLNVRVTDELQRVSVDTNVARS